MFCLMSRDSCEKLVTINTYPLYLIFALPRDSCEHSNSESNNNHIQKPWENSYSYHVPLVEFLLIDLVIDQRKIVYQFTRINRVHLRQLFECLPLLKSWPISMGYYSLWCKKLYSNNPCLFSPS